METSLFYTDAKVSEYLLVISPPDNIKEDIVVYKNKLAEKIGVYEGLYSKAHITLTNFLLSLERMEIAFMYFEHLFRYMHSFSLSLKDFDHFDTHTVFVKPVKNRQTIVDMQHNAYNLLKHNMRLKNIAGKLSHPHLTIARQLTSDKYQIAWDYFKRVNYSAHFYVDKIILLKRNNRGKYEKVKEFLLE